MKKGFTLIELMIAISVILVLATTGFISVKNRSEKNAQIKMKTQIPTYLTNQMNEAYESGEKYTIKYNEEEKRLETYSGTELIEKLQLESSLQYSINPTENTINSQGAYDNEMTIDVSDKENNSLFDVHIIRIEAVNSSKIEVNS